MSTLYLSFHGLFVMSLVGQPGPPAPAYPPLSLSRHEGQTVTLVGTVSMIPWQHLMTSRPGKTEIYFDLKDAGQIVVYVPSGPERKGPMLAKGTVIKVQGQGRGSKAGTDYVEYHLDADRAECPPTPQGLVEGLLDRLVGPDFTEDEKREAEEAVIAMGSQSMETLLAHLKDDRAYETRQTILNEGALLNAPANAKPLEPQYSQEIVPVGARCELLLYRIITPEDYISPYQANFKPISLGGPESWMFRIEDWTAWWQKNKGRSLDDIRERMKPVIDAYYKSQGREQIVK